MSKNVITYFCYTLRTIYNSVPRFFRVIIFLLLPAVVSAQQTSADSLRIRLQRDSAHIYRFKKVHFLFSFDQRNTFFATPKDNNTAFDLLGVKAGLVFNERHKVGVGLYSIRNHHTRLEHTNRANEDISLKFNYTTLFYEYLFISNRRWDIGIPVEAGIGHYKISAPTPPTGDQSGDQPLVMPSGIALDVHFKPMRWFSLNGMGGYRYVLNTNNSIDLSNWFYAFGISISTRHIVEDGRYYLKKRKYKKDIARLTGQ
jgi:hypothetical protein